MTKRACDTPKQAEVYREAARLVERSSLKGGIYGCDAIWYALGAPLDGPQRKDYTRARDAFADYFQPEDRPYIWFGNRMDGINERVVALCFMAAITERT